MKRLPLILATLIVITIAGIITVPLFVLWLLGANKPFKIIGNAFNEIIFDK